LLQKVYDSDAFAGASPQPIPTNSNRVPVQLFRAPFRLFYIPIVTLTVTAST
jgi:hypothetical protein